MSRTNPIDVLDTRQNRMQRHGAPYESHKNEDEDHQS
jgi:hypothetical protein